MNRFATGTGDDVVSVGAGFERGCFHLKGIQIQLGLGKLRHGPRSPNLKFLNFYL